MRQVITLLVGLLAIAASALAQTTHTLTLKPGDRLIIESAGEPPATQPQVAKPALSVKHTAEGFVITLDRAHESPVGVWARNKQSVEKIGTIPPGDKTLAKPFAGSAKLPLNTGWDYWFWGVAGDLTGDEVKESVGAAAPTTKPVEVDPVSVEIPKPPANALVTSDPREFERTVNAGKPAVLDGARWDYKLTLKNHAAAWVRNSTGTVPAGGWGNGHLIHSTGQSEALYIHDNTITGQNGDAAIAVGWHRGPDQLRHYVIAHNDFIDLHEPVHVFGPYPAGHNVGVIANNYFERIRRYGLEIQHGGKSLLIEGNYYHRPWINPATGFVKGPDVEFASAAANETETVIIRNNISVMNSAARWNDKDRNGYHVEAGGRDTRVYGNVLIGPGVAGVAALSTHGDKIKSQVRIYDNLIAGVPDKAMGWGGPVIGDGGTLFPNNWRTENTILQGTIEGGVFKATTGQVIPIPQRPAGVGRRTK